MQASLETGGVKITWLNHASFLVEWAAGKTAYFDPFVLPANARKADVVLVTHEHYDHCAPDKIKQIAGADTVIVCAESCMRKVAGLGCKKIGLREGGQAVVDGVSVNAVPAYTPAKRFHPRGLGVGLVADFNGVRVYHAGDTDFIPEMAAFAQQKISVALLPIGGTYTMNEEEAAQAANAIAPETAVPMHFNYLEGTRGDSKKFASLVDESIKVVVLQRQVV